MIALPAAVGLVRALPQGQVERRRPCSQARLRDGGANFIGCEINVAADNKPITS
jgi:hypothetical protein